MIRFVGGIIVGIALAVGGVSGVAALMDSALDTTKESIEKAMNGKTQNSSR